MVAGILCGLVVYARSARSVVAGKERRASPGTGEDPEGASPGAR